MTFDFEEFRASRLASDQRKSWPIGLFADAIDEMQFWQSVQERHQGIGSIELKLDCIHQHWTLFVSGDLASKILPF